MAATVPLGTAAAVLLYRTDLPFRRTFRFLTILALFVPLPLFASGWQAVLGSTGWLPLALVEPAPSRRRQRHRARRRLGAVGSGHRLRRLDSRGGRSAVGDPRGRPRACAGWSAIWKRTP